MMERESLALALPYDLSIYDSVFYELRMEYVKSNDSKLSSMERQLEVLQTAVKSQSNSQTTYESICSQARIITETACASLLLLFPELKAKILVLLEDPSSSTYAQIQNFGTFFHDKQSSDPYLFANGKKFVQYVNMLRQIGNLSSHINTADVNVFDALTTIASSIQVATLLLGFSMKQNPFASQFSMPSMDLSYQTGQQQLFQQPTLFQPVLFNPQMHHSQQQQQPQHHLSQQSLQQPYLSHQSQQMMQTSQQMMQQPQQKQGMMQHQFQQQQQNTQQPLQQQPQQQQNQLSYQQKLLHQPYLAVLTRPPPPSQPASQPIVVKENGGHPMNGMTPHHPYHTTTTTTTTATPTSMSNGSASMSSNILNNNNNNAQPQKYETSHLWVRNVDIAIDKNSLASRFQSHVNKELIQNIYINTPEIDNPLYYTAYINFKNVDAATRAKNVLDGVMLGSRKVSIQFNECPSLLKKGKMCTSCKILSEQKGKVVWSKYWANNGATNKK